MRNWLFSQLMKWWREDDIPHTHPDYVVIVSFGTLRDELTSGSIACTQLGISICEYKNKRPVFIFGAFTPTADKLGEVERKLREEMIRRAGFETIFAGNVASTIEECLEIKAKIPPTARTGKVQNILVCTEDCHSRRAKLVWREELPRSDYNVRVVSFNTKMLEENSQPMFMARNRWKWFFINFVVYYLFCIPPVYRYFKRNCKTMRQPTAS